MTAENKPGKGKNSVGEAETHKGEPVQPLSREQRDLIRREVGNTLNRYSAWVYGVLTTVVFAIGGLMTYFGISSQLQLSTIIEKAETQKNEMVLAATEFEGKKQTLENKLQEMEGRLKAADGLLRDVEATIQ